MFARMIIIKATKMSQFAKSLNLKVKTAYNIKNDNSYN